jgi:acetyltransferase-like isoleucine patch superfamily enzyme
MHHINDTTKPVIFLGSNKIMYYLQEVCDSLGIAIAGIIDKDYWGNTSHVCEIPVIDSEDSFADPVKLDYYQRNFNFFCATNWTPENLPSAIRNRHKRMHLLSLIKQHELSCISIVDPTARVSKYSTVGRSTWIDANVEIGPKSCIEDFSNIYSNTYVGPYVNIGDNCVIQRNCFITDGSQIEHDSYFGLCAKALKTGARFGAGTFIHEAVYIRRGTVPNETVGMDGSNMKRVVPYPIVI